MESLVGVRYFSTMDLKSGFWQVKMSEESCQYKAFTVGSMGVYKFLRMPYGLCNVPATFQHLMQNCLGELNLQFALIYLDNVINYSRMREDHLTHLQAVLDWFAHHGLKLKLLKCHFFKENITYLGHEISAKGMLPGQEGIEKITNMGPPTTVTGIRKFTGAVGYFCHFIKNFSHITRPLDNLTSCENSKLKNHPVTLTPTALEVFETLKKKCMTAPVLAFADLEKPFVLETDASEIGLGAMLLQEQEDKKLHPVTYASRALHGSEKNYHSSKLEFLALKWAITEQFREYLSYKPFAVRTDNNPLTYIMMTLNLDAVGQRWVSALARFDFKIEYLKGSDNKVADVLGRVKTRLDNATTKEFLADCPNTILKGAGYAKVDEDPDTWTKVQKEAVNEVMERVKFQHIPHAETDSPMLIAKHEEVEKENTTLVAQLVATRDIKHNLVGTDWKTLQEADPILRHVLKWVHQNDGKTKADKNARNADRCTLEEYLKTVINPFNAKAYGDRQKDLVIQNDLLFIKDTPKNCTESVLLFIVPVNKHQVVLDLCHCDAGHQGWDRTYSLLRERFWWPKMRTQMMNNILNCNKCKVFERKDPKPPLCNITASEPMDLVHVDLLGLETTMNTKVCPMVAKILVIMDHFPCHVQAYKVDDKKAVTIAKCLYDNYFRHYRFPRQLMSDQGKEFRNNILKEMCYYLNIKKIHTMPYHPQSNRSIKHVHYTLCWIIRKLDNK